MGGKQGEVATNQVLATLNFVHAGCMERVDFALEISGNAAFLFALCHKGIQLLLDRRIERRTLVMGKGFLKMRLA